MALIWALNKRIYSYSRRYVLPRYDEDEKAPTWVYMGTFAERGLRQLLRSSWEVEYSQVNLN